MWVDGIGYGKKISSRFQSLGKSMLKGIRSMLRIIRISLKTCSIIFPTSSSGIDKMLVIFTSKQRPTSLSTNMPTISLKKMIETRMSTSTSSLLRKSAKTRHSRSLNITSRMTPIFLSEQRKK